MTAIGESNPLLDALGPAGRAYEHLLPGLIGGGPLLRAEEVAFLALALNLLLIVSCLPATRAAPMLKTAR